MARRRTFRQNQGQRRLTDWYGGVAVGYTSPKNIGAAATAIDSAIDFRVFPNTDGAPGTIVRLRGLFQVYPSDLTVDRIAFGALGLCIVNGEAFDAGAASVPVPWTESFSDRWFYYTYWSTVSKTDVGATEELNWVGGSEPIIIDSKAMRKVEEQDVMVAVIEAASSGSGADYFLNYRTLIKMH